MPGSALLMVYLLPLAFLAMMAVLVAWRTRGGRGDVPGAVRARFGVFDTPLWGFPLLAFVLVVLVLSEGSWLTLALFLLALALFAWNGLRGVCVRGRGVECRGCGYERPPERTAQSEVCPECANRWWIKPLAFIPMHGDPGDRAGVRPLGWRRAYPRWRACLVVLVAASGAHLALSLWYTMGNLKNVLPTPVLLMLVDSSDSWENREVMEELLSRSNLSSAHAGTLMDVIVRGLERGENPINYVFQELEHAIGGGVFTDAQLERFYAGALEWTLRARVEEGGVRPVLHFVGRPRTIGLQPLVIVKRARIDDGAWVPIRTLQSGPESFAETFRDLAHANPDGSGVLTEKDYGVQRGEHGLDAISFPGLEPGTHTLTLELHEFVAGPNSTVWNHAFWPPGKGLSLPPQTLWDRHVELTTTFVIEGGGP